MSLEIPGLSSDNLLAFGLIFTRMVGFFLMAPLLSGRSVPAPVKALLAATTSLLLLPVVGVETLPSGGADQVLLLGKELVVGMLLGFVVGMIAVGWQIAGGLLDLSMGFSYGGILDPLYGNQSSVLQQFYGILALALFVVIGGPELMLLALDHSFQLVPLDQMAPVGDLAQVALATVGQGLIIGIGVAGPVLIALLLTDVAFGLLSRVAPQTQIIQVEFPVKIAVGMLVITATVPWMLPYLRSSLEALLGLI